MNATWDTLLHSKPECYPTHKSRDEVPVDEQIIIAQKIGDWERHQVIRVGDNLVEWRYKTTDVLFCKVADLYIWRGCGGFDF